MSPAFDFVLNAAGELCQQPRNLPGQACLPPLDAVLALRRGEQVGVTAYDADEVRGAWDRFGRQRCEVCGDWAMSFVCDVVESVGADGWIHREPGARHWYCTPHTPEQIMAALMGGE